MLSLWAVRALERCLRLVHTWSSPLLPEGPLAAELQLVGAGLAAMCCARPLTRTLTRTLTLTLPVPVPVRLPVPVPLALTAALRLARYCVWLAYLLLRMARRLHLLDARSRVSYYLSGATACVEALEGQNQRLAEHDAVFEGWKATMEKLEKKVAGIESGTAQIKGTAQVPELIAPRETKSSYTNRTMQNSHSFKVQQVDLF